jgi:hypothetical protein
MIIESYLPPWEIELRISTRVFDEVALDKMLRHDNAYVTNEEFSSALKDELDFSIRRKEEAYGEEPSLKRWYNYGFEVLSMTDCKGTEYTKRDCQLKIEGKW